METLEQYGIKDVTPGNSVGSSVRLRGVRIHASSMIYLYIGDRFVGGLSDPVGPGKTVGDETIYESKGSSVWLSEVSYN